MNYVFLMSPLESIIASKDTSLAIMVGAHRRGHGVFFIPDGGIVCKNGQLLFHASQVTPQFDAKNPFIDCGAVDLTQDDAHVVFVRSDPPFDARYLQNMWLLDLLPKHIAVINTPSGIRTVNEKVWASQFTTVVPPTLIGRNRCDLHAFLEEYGDIIVKPTDRFGGQSIFRVRNGDDNIHVIFETVTQNWRKDIILQKYISAAHQGDKRILLLDGEPLGAVLRVHAPDDHRNNFFAGGRPKACEITNRDQEIVTLLKPELQKLGIYFAGIDIIGDYLIEVNVTSPTGLQEINRLGNLRLEDNVIAFSEELVGRLSSTNRIAH